MRSQFHSFMKSAPLLLAVLLGMAVATPSSAQTAAPTTKAKAKAKSKAAPTSSTLIDLNKATAEEMVEILPGVGEVTAQKIIAGRPYKAVDDLANAGIPAATVEKIRKQVTVSTPAPAPVADSKKAATKGMTKTAAAAPVEPTGKVNLNEAKAEELETLPGIGPARAKEIIASRPYKSVDDLEKVKGLGKERIDVLRKLVIVSTPALAPVPVPSAAAATTKPAAKEAMTKKATASASEAPKSRLAPGKLVSLNKGSRDDLDLLPGIGPVKAQAILDYRASSPFKTKEDIMKVKGIKEGEFAKIKDLIVVD